MKKTIEIVLLIIAVLTATNANAQMFHPDVPKIVPFTISLRTLNEKFGFPDGRHRFDGFYGAFAVIPPTYYKQTGGKPSQGILVVYTADESFYAMELDCPHCHYDLGKITGMRVVHGDAICPECGAEVHGFVLYGNCLLSRYDNGHVGPRRLHTYEVDVEGQGMDVKLTISNNPSIY